MDKLLEKLKELGIDEAIVESIKADYNAAVDEKVSTKLAVALEESEKTISEKYKKEAEEEKEKFKKELDEKAEADFKALEEGLLAQLDEFIDTQIIDNIDEGLLDEVAANKFCEKVVKGIMKVFEEDYVALDTEGAGLLKKAAERVAAVEADCNAKIEENIALQKENAELKKEKFLSEKTANLSEEHKLKVAEFFKDKDLDECEAKIGSFLEVLKETAAKTPESTPLNEDDTPRPNIPEPKNKTLTLEEALIKNAGNYL